MLDNRPYLPLALVLTLVACSDRTVSPDAAVSWPDLGADASHPDRAVADRALADQRRPDQRPPDARRPDSKPATSSWKLTRPTSENLNAVACGKGHVFAAGTKGTLLYAGPAASTFTKQKVPTTVELLTVTFASDKTGTFAYTAGRSYDIWESRNWGTSWTVAAQCSAYVFDAFYALHVSTTTEGFGCGEASSSQGGGIKYWSGYSWVCVSPTYPKMVFYDVARLGKQGWAVGDTGGKIYRTEDQGMSWSAVQTLASVPLRGVHFVTAKLGVAVGDKGAIFRSGDGKGALWGYVSSPTAENLNDVYFADAKNGWAVGDKGVVLHTADGGNSWTLQVTPTSDKLNGVCFSSASEGWAVGAKGALLHTTKGGK